MSGGSYNYLCYNTDLESLAQRRNHDLRDMAERLAGLSEAEFPGATAAAKRTAKLREQMQIWDIHVQAQAELLAGVWKAVEWWDSSDWGPDQVAEVLAKFVTPEVTPDG